MVNNVSSLDKVKVWSFLMEHPIGVVTSLNLKNIPESAVVYFFAKSDFTCFFVTKVMTRKYQNFLQNSIATLTVFHEKALTSVEIQGTVETVIDGAKVAQVIEKFQELILQRNSSYWVPPISQIEAGQYVVCMLTPTLVHFNNFSLESGETTPERLMFPSKE